MWLVEAAVVVVLLGVVQHYRAVARRERLERLNVMAAADSTHHFLRGQLQVATRLVVQRPLGGGRVVTLTVEVPGDTVRRVDTLVLADTLRARLDTNGLHVAAMVALAPPPPVWTWVVAREAVRYRAEIGCQDGAARLTVSGPRYQALQLTNLQQAPGICNPPPRWEPFSFRLPSVWWLGAAFGTGLLVSR